MFRLFGWIGAVAFAIVGCEGTHREYEVAPPQAALAGHADGAGAAGGLGSADNERAPTDLELAPAAGMAAAPGEACSTNADCGSGFCVDGVCCRSSCDTVCSRCDGPGTEGSCTVAGNDAACGLSCPQGTDCRSYGSGALTANCEAVGLCRILAGCQSTDAPAGTACKQGTGSCDGRGECVVAGRKRLGEACAADEECAEGNCIIGSGGAAICCDAECAGLCQTCGASGHCNETPRDDARCSAVDCPDDNLCRDYVADLEVNLCRGFGQCRTQVDCTFTELRSGVQCNCGPGGCTLAAGSSCTSALDCASGACEATAAGGKVCCAQGCSALGQSCAADGSRCVQCDGDGATCEGNVSRRCANGLLNAQSCGNGCDATTGLCNSQRPTGSVCDGAAQCQSGVCATDVSGTQRCCDASCTSSGRACGTNGSCVCPAGRQDVGGSCRLSVGQACAQSSDCASGACVGKVSGGSVCCAQGCNGNFCTADGSRCVECEGAASNCQGNTAARCDDGDLVQSQCGNGCSAATGVCNGLLPNGQNCTAGTQCASNTCAADLNGAQRCCTPNCAASGRVCGVDGACVCQDPTDVFVNGACRNAEGRACSVDGDCRSNACEPTQAGAQVCCSGACNGQICRTNGQGCVACEGNASTCQGNNSRSCVNNAFVNTTCANGCNAATGQCNNLIPRGGTGCTSNAQCAGSGASCQNQRCCEFNCAAAGKTCDSAGLCQCPSSTIAVGNACLLPNGVDCTAPGDCASGRCNRWYFDLDGDLHGDPMQPLGVCGNAGEAAPGGLVASSDDCCDRHPDVFPGQIQFIGTPQAVCPNVLPYDYDCDSRITSLGQYTIDRAITTCDQIPLADCRDQIIWVNDPGDADVNVIPQCGALGLLNACSSISQGVPRGQCVGIAGDTIVNRCR